ncbi:MAG: DUF885 family protein, partial [Novosphingobium sp.]
MSNHSLTRRQALGGLSAAGAALSLPSMSYAATASQQDRAVKVLENIAWDLLRLSPEGATSLGIDTGANAALRSKLEDRSAAGQARKAALLRRSLQQLSAINPAKVDDVTRTSLAVVKSAFGTALDGFKLPYGDVAIGGWRNTPYVVIQNVGAYLDTPRFLDGDHPVRSASDAEAYLSRLSQMPEQLD